jgi:hypothetical protein
MGWRANSAVAANKEVGDSIRLSLLPGWGRPGVLIRGLATTYGKWGGTSQSAWWPTRPSHRNGRVLSR